MSQGTLRKKDVKLLKPTKKERCLLTVYAIKDEDGRYYNGKIRSLWSFNPASARKFNRLKDARKAWRPYRGVARIIEVRNES